jgi:hypothetical protein
MSNGMYWSEWCVQLRQGVRALRWVGQETQSLDQVLKVSGSAWLGAERRHKKLES